MTWFLMAINTVLTYVLNLLLRRAKTLQSIHKTKLTDNELNFPVVTEGVADCVYG